MGNPDIREISWSHHKEGKGYYKPKQRTERKRADRKDTVNACGVGNLLCDSKGEDGDEKFRRVGESPAANMPMESMEATEDKGERTVETGKV